MIALQVPTLKDANLYQLLAGIVRRAVDGTVLPLFVDYANQYVGVKTTSPTEALHVLGNLLLGTAGNGVKIKEGSNATMGVATLVAGAVTVSTTKVTANSRIFAFSQAAGGTPGWLRISARVAATSFTITSSDALDTSTVAWLIVEPG